MQQQKTYLFITCPGHSSSTLLAILLATHPDISSIGELVPMKTPLKVGRPACSCGEAILSCTFWNNVENVLKEEGYSFFDFEQSIDFRQFFSKLLYYPVPFKEGEQIRNAFLSLLSKMVSAQGRELAQFSLRIGRAATVVENTRVFADATKETYLLRLLIEEISQQDEFYFKVLHLVRDVRGVVASYVRINRAPDVTNAARYWVRYHKKIERIKNYYLRPEQTLLVHYSELCRQPQREMGRICNFLGIDEQFTLEQINPNQYHIHGNTIRKRPIEKIISDERWKKELTENDLQIIKHIAAKTSQHYGIVL